MRKITRREFIEENYAVVWMTSIRNFAVLAATNQGGEVAAKACDTAAAELISKFLS